MFHIHPFKFISFFLLCIIYSISSNIFHFFTLYWPFHLRKRYCASANYSYYFREFRAIFTEKVHGHGKYLRKKSISKDFDVKNFEKKMSDIPRENLLKKKKVGEDKKCGFRNCRRDSQYKSCLECTYYFISKTQFGISKR